MNRDQLVLVYGFHNHNLTEGGGRRNRRILFMRTLLLNSILMQENGSFQTNRTCSTLGEFTIRLWLEKEGWTKNRE